MIWKAFEPSEFCFGALAKEKIGHRLINSKHSDGDKIQSESSAEDIEYCLFDFCLYEMLMFAFGTRVLLEIIDMVSLHLCSLNVSNWR